MLSVTTEHKYLPDGNDLQGEGRRPLFQKTFKDVFLM